MTEKPFYEKYPELKEYFLSLPADVREFILGSGADITTLGELQLCAEQYKIIGP